MFTQEEEREQRALVTTTVNPFGAVAKSNGGAMVDIGQAREVADVQAAMLIAQRFPRDQIAAMDRILMAFTRPTLAETALYEYGRGGSDVSGLSIRAAEAMAQQWGHIHMGVEEVDRRGGASTVRAWCFDAQTGTRDSKVFQVKHWRDTKKGGYQITDERDIYELIANMAARRKRACILAVIPGDVQEAVKRQIETTLKAKIEITPELLKSLEEKFAAFGVTVSMIEKRIQRRMEAITPGLVMQLGKIYNSLKDGMSTPAEWFEAEPPSPASGPPPSKGDGIKDALRAKTKPAVDKETGEVTRPSLALDGNAPAGPSYAEVRERIEKAKDRDTLDMAAGFIDGLPPQFHAELHEIVKQRREKVGA
ncbi:MAG: hypothetical protein IT381_32855 [Deltaproteobacteria bacterium]|nr:hypothetical protein [Deltaproteobacteria bacterium]